jgi:DNA-binding NarL/FixJ family response regulator
MNENELISEAVPGVQHESGPELNRVGVYQEPLTQVWEVPIRHLATQPPALRSKLAQPPKRVFIVEDCPAFRERLTQILNDAGDLMVCGTAGAVDQALPAIALTKPDFVLADINLPGKRGLEFIKELRSAHRSVKLLAISSQQTAHHAASVLRAGGDGYIVKQEDPDELLCAIHDVLEGHIYVSEKVVERPRAGRRSRNFGQASI